MQQFKKICFIKQYSYGKYDVLDFYSVYEIDDGVDAGN